MISSTAAKSSATTRWKSCDCTGFLTDSELRGMLGGAASHCQGETPRRLRAPGALRTIAHPELSWAISLPYANARRPFRSRAAMPAHTYSYQALGEQDQRRTSMYA